MAASGKLQPNGEGSAFAFCPLQVPAPPVEGFLLPDRKAPPTNKVSGAILRSRITSCGTDSIGRKTALFRQNQAGYQVRRKSTVAFFAESTTLLTSGSNPRTTPDRSAIRVA